MKKCPDCAESVQDDAKICRFCRHEFKPSNTARPVATTQPEKTSSGAVWGCLGIIVFLGVIGSIAGSSDEDPSTTNATAATAEAKEAAAPESPYADTAKQAAWIAAGQVAIKNQLRDPGSAKFRNVHFYSGGGVPVTCGEVNAKNAFGGYTGFERFVAAADIISATESQVDGGLGPVWDKYCVKAKWDRM